MQRAVHSQLMIGAGILLAGTAAMAAPSKKAQKQAPHTTSPFSAQVAPQGITYALKAVIREKSAAFCAAYGVESGCIEDVEICITMLDRDEDTVRVCVNAAPERDSIQSGRARQ